MEKIFFNVLHMSMNAVWFMLAILVFREVFRFASKRIRLILWYLLAAALVIPYRIPFRFSLVPITGSDIRMSETTIVGTLPKESGTVGPYLKETIQHVEKASSTTVGWSMSKTMTILWIAGLVICLGYAVLQYLRLNRMTRLSKPLKKDVFLCDGIRTAFIYGIFNPQIFIPSSIETGEMEYIMMHERVHKQRYDHLKKIAGYLVLCLHWFNPLVWCSWILFCRDIESACDESVISGLSFDDRKKYAETLLKCAGPGRHWKNHMTIGVSFGESNVKNRVKQILKYKNRGFITSIVAVAICVTMAGCFLTTPKQSSHDITITVPANMPKGIWYAPEEIKSYGKSVKICSLEAGTLQVILEESINANNKDTHENAVENEERILFPVERNTWYRIGVNAENPTDVPLLITLEVNNSDIRMGNETLNTDKADAYRTAGLLVENNAFSYESLATVLRYTGFKKEDAYWAVDQQELDFDEQAVWFVEKLLEDNEYWCTPQSVIEIMRLERFTEEQIQYGIQNCNCDWNKAAVADALRLVEYGCNTEELLVQQLKWDGFTDEQTQYALDYMAFSNT